MSGDTLRLRAANGEALLVPMDVFPSQRKMLAGASQATEPRQRHDQPPFVARAGINHFLDVCMADEALPLGVSDGCRNQVRKRILDDQFSVDCLLEEMLRESGVLADAGFRHPALHQKQPPVLGIRFRQGLH
ncbi:MAG: hypothetical protein NT013_00515 [Planctomycetia bacterium]|nr:hypothetical protein [Planctomycetia bacterium]